MPTTPESSPKSDRSRPSARHPSPGRKRRRRVAAAGMYGGRAGTVKGAVRIGAVGSVLRGQLASCRLGLQTSCRRVVVAAHGGAGAAGGGGRALAGGLTRDPVPSAAPAAAKATRTAKRLRPTQPAPASARPSTHHPSRRRSRRGPAAPAGFARPAVDRHPRRLQGLGDRPVHARAAALGAAVRPRRGAVGAACRFWRLACARRCHRLAGCVTDTSETSSSSAAAGRQACALLGAGTPGVKPIPAPMPRGNQGRVVQVASVGRLSRALRLRNTVRVA